MCVSQKHGLVIVSNGIRHQLDMYSLADGVLVRSIGGPGSGKGQFHFSMGGMCVSPGGDSVLVAEFFNDRVQQVQIVDGQWTRYVGTDALFGPQCIDCNADVIVVAEDCHRVTVLSWATGIVRAQFGSEGCGVGQVMYPCGVKLAYDGSEVTVADTWNNRLSVFSLCGTSVVTVGGRQSERNNPRWCELNNPSDVIPLAPGGDFVAASCRTLKRASRDGTTTVIHDLQFRPTALAALSNGDVVVRDGAGGYLVLHDIRLRCLWMIACTNVNRRSAAHSAHASKRGRHGKCIP